MYLVSVYFDGETERILRGHIERIAERSGNAFMTANNVPPHLTVASLEARSADELLPAFRKLSGKACSGRVNFVSIGQFFPYVIYSAALYDDYLRELSEKVHVCFEGLNEVSSSRFYLPGSWLPHVTLGKTLDRQQMRAAFETLQDNFVPFAGTVTAMGLAAVNPHRDLERIEL